MPQEIQLIIAKWNWEWERERDIYRSQHPKPFSFFNCAKMKMEKFSVRATQSLADSCVCVCVRDPQKHSYNFHAICEWWRWLCHGWHYHEYASSLDIIYDGWIYRGVCMWCLSSNQATKICFAFSMVCGHGRSLWPQQARKSPVKRNNTPQQIELYNLARYACFMHVQWEREGLRFTQIRMLTNRSE